MKPLHYLTTALAALLIFCAPLALADDEPNDAWVKGLWIKATNLPDDDLFLEDFTQDDDGNEPYFIYSFGTGEDGYAVTMPVGRYPQDETAKKLARLDIQTLAKFVGSQEFFKDAKNLQFTAAPEFSEQFGYPCQLATFDDTYWKSSHAVLFIQTDQYMFMAHVVRETNSKEYGADDAVRWLRGLKLVEQ